MLLVIFIFVAVVLATAGGFFLLDSRLRRSDLDSIKSRLLGTAAKAANTRGAVPALMQSEDAKQDRMVLELLRRFRLRHRLQELLEHAGLLACGAPGPARSCGIVVGFFCGVVPVAAAAGSHRVRHRPAVRSGAGLIRMA